jgi:hypothetical protein
MFLLKDSNVFGETMGTLSRVLMESFASCQSEQFVGWVNESCSICAAPIS